MIKISVIIPVYNTEKYLSEALDSIISQSLTDFEIICLDDGSKDSSLDILKEYAHKDERVHVLSQENQGVSVARNSAVKEARGKYLFFFDSDDILKDFALKEAFDLAEKNNAEIVCMDYQKFDADGIIADSITPGFSLGKIDKEVFTWRDIPQSLVDADALLGPVWGKLILKDFYMENQFEFPKGVRYAEDCVVCLPMMLRAKKIYYVSKVCLDYRIVKKGVAGREMFFDFLEAYSLMDKAIEPENDPYIVEMLSQRKVYMFRRALKENPEIKEKSKEILRTYLSEYEYNEVMRVDKSSYKIKKLAVNSLCSIIPSKKMRRSFRKKYL
ncbi:MAG: glycosyltransferase family 2 protein [Alphaproteobacteria bacterium]